MQLVALAVTLFCSASALLEAQMNVSVCSPGDIRGPIVTNAKTEAQFVFSSAGIRITWLPCDDFTFLDTHVTGPLFIVRLRGDVSRQAVGSTSLDLMGKAFLAKDGRGKIADAYVHSIQTNAMLYRVDAGSLLGCVIAHELGHLLLGPGHAASGVMRTGWRGEEARYVDKRWLKFTPGDSARLRHGLALAIAEGRLPES